MASVSSEFDVEWEKGFFGGRLIGGKRVRGSEGALEGRGKLDSVFTFSYEKKLILLAMDSRLCKRLCPLMRPSVGQSLRWSVTLESKHVKTQNTAPAPPPSPATCYLSIDVPYQ